MGQNTHGNLCRKSRYQLPLDTKNSMKTCVRALMLFILTALVVLPYFSIIVIAADPANDHNTANTAYLLNAENNANKANAATTTNRVKTASTANTENAATPVASAAEFFTVYIKAGGKTVKAAAYSEEQFASIGTQQQRYSSLDSEGAPVTIIAEGVLISSLLDAFALTDGDIDALLFSSADGWSKSFEANSYIDSNRYYYSGIVSGYDVASSEAAGAPEFIEGTENNKQAVPAMLAVRLYEGRFEENPATDKLSEVEALRFCHGQAAITDTVMLSYGKRINSITINIKAGSSYILPEGEEADTDSGSLFGIPEGGLPEKLDTIGLKAETLTITVGYYGGTYYTKKVFTYDEMVKLATVRQVYSYIDNMPAVCLTAAIGVPMTRLLEEAGVDVNSVHNFNFYCADVARTWYTSMTKAQLLDTPRFYYPKLSSRWDYDEMKPLSMATADAEEVEALIAISDKWRRFATEIDFTDMTETTRYRLVFGQADIYSLEASKSAKWVHTIAVTLGGSPPRGITTDSSILDGKVGSTYTISANVEKSDATTDTRVTWSSSDESIAIVDRNGKVTIIGEGEAVITVTTIIGGLTKEIAINATLQNNEPDDNANATITLQPDDYNDAAATPQSAENTDSNPDSLQGIETDAEQTMKSQEIIEAETAQNADTANDSSQEQHDAAQPSNNPPETTAGIYRVVLGGMMQESEQPQEQTPEITSVQNWRRHQMAQDAMALAEINADNAALWQTALALSVLFLVSFAARIVKFRMETDNV